MCVRQCVIQSGAFLEFKFVRRAVLGKDSGRVTAFCAQRLDLTGEPGCAADGQHRFAMVLSHGTNIAALSPLVIAVESDF